MSQIKLFQPFEIRSYGNEEKQKWYFSVVDVVGVLSASNNPRRYWRDLKRKLKQEGAEQLYENLVQLKLKAPHGRMRKTNLADTETLWHIFQSIPSPNAELCKFEAKPISMRKGNTTRLSSQGSIAGLAPGSSLV